MKKLFSLILALALAFAAAVPALASGWDQLPTTAPALKDITIKITALNTEANTSVLGSLYEQLSVMTPVVKGTLVHYYVELTIPAQANLSAANRNLLTYNTLKYQLSLMNLELYNDSAHVCKAYKDGADRGLSTSDTRFASETFILSDAGSVWSYEYWAKAKADGAATACAKIGFYNEWSGGEFGWDNDADGVDEFIVYHTSGLYTIAAAGTSCVLAFPVIESTGKIDVSREMVFGYNSVNYAITRAVNGDITFRNMATNQVYTPSDGSSYTTLKAGFDAFFTALGFGYTDAKYMTEQHFTAYFGKIAETSAAATWPSGTVVPTTPAVPAPTVNPPQTGDASTVAGFVMIALALAAAAAATVRKIRA